MVAMKVLCSDEVMAGHTVFLSAASWVLLKGSLEAVAMGI